MKFIFIFIFIHFTFVFYSQEIFGTCLGKSFVVEKNIWTKSPLVNLETREIKIFFSDSSISRLYAVRLSTSNFRSRIYLQKNKNLLMNSSKLIKRLNATVIINAGFYNRNYRPMGFFRSGTKTYNSRILFKPTKASKEQFRPKIEMALSYFLGGKDSFCSEDEGFALKPWVDVKFKNSGFIIEENRAIAMGNYFFTDSKGCILKVEYTFG